MGIQAVKGVEIGDGFDLARRRGTEAHDEIEPGLAPPHEPCRRSRGGHVERRADRRPRGDEAAADADAPARLGRSRHGRRRRRRSSSAATCRRSRRSPSSPRRRSRGSSRARRARSSAATRSATWSPRTRRVPRADRRRGGARPLNALDGTSRSPGSWARARRRVGERRRRAARPAVRRPRRRDRAARRGHRGGALRAAAVRPAFRALEEEVAARALAARGAVGRRARRRRRRSPSARAHALAARAFTVLLDVDPATAWERVRGAERPLGAGRGGLPRALRAAPGRSTTRSPTARARRRRRRRARGGRRPRRARRDRAPRRARARRRSGRARRRRARRRHPRRRARSSRSARATSACTRCPQGEAAKSAAVLERLWSTLRLGRDGTLVALGGGCDDRRGRASPPRRTCVVSPGLRCRRRSWARSTPRSAARRRSTSRREEPRRRLPLAGAGRCRPDRCSRRLPEAERANGLAEVVKTGLLAGEPLWELPEPSTVRALRRLQELPCACATRTSGAPARQLNLGHTFAHALEAAAGYDLPHGRAVALGLLAALRLSGLDDARRTVERELLRPEPVRIDRDAAWAALGRDKKAARGTPQARPARRARQRRAGVSSCPRPTCERRWTS